MEISKNNIININGIDVTPSRIILLPSTEKTSNLHLGNSNTMYYSADPRRIMHEGYTHQNIYFTSDDEAKKGDWRIRITTNGQRFVEQITDDTYNFESEKYLKIIATNDSAILPLLPEPSIDFLIMYAKIYNHFYKSKPFDVNALVQCTYDNGEAFVPMNTTYLLINNDNTINTFLTKAWKIN